MPCEFFTSCVGSKSEFSTASLFHPRLSAMVAERLYQNLSAHFFIKPSSRNPSTSHQRPSTSINANQRQSTSINLNQPQSTFPFVNSIRKKKNLPVPNFASSL